MVWSKKPGAGTLGWELRADGNRSFGAMGKETGSREMTEQREDPALGDGAVWEQPRHGRELHGTGAGAGSHWLGKKTVESGSLGAAAAQRR
jgi:hypothetical protein